MPGIPNGICSADRIGSFPLERVGTPIGSTSTLLIAAGGAGDAVVDAPRDICPSVPSKRDCMLGSMLSDGAEIPSVQWRSRSLVQR
jgi:hypothetical protein